MHWNPVHADNHGVQPDSHRKEAHGRKRTYEEDREDSPHSPHNFGSVIIGDHEWSNKRPKN